ncbi:MAG: ABC transporter permease [Methanobacteriota archaeon]|nr:MAG: ABC transporter permease [Euryarchaeota archaeon]
MLGLRYFVWNSEKLNYLVVGMVISMMAFASTTLIIDGLTTEIDSLTSTVQNEVTEVTVISQYEVFTSSQLIQFQQIIAQENLNPYGLTRNDLEALHNQTSVISNVQYLFSRVTFADLSDEDSSRRIQFTFTNLTQLFGTNAIKFQLNDSLLINQGYWINDPSFFVIGELYHVYITDVKSELNLTLQSTYQDAFGSGILADWNVIWKRLPLDQTNRLQFSIISSSLLEGLVTKKNLNRVIAKLTEIEGIEIKTNSAVTKYLEISKNDIIRLLRVLLVSIFVLILVSIVNSTYLLIQERKKELKVLKAIGFTRFSIVRLIMTQFILVSILSSLFSYITSLVIYNLIFSTLALIFNSIYVVSDAQFQVLFELILLSSTTSILGTAIGLVITKKEDPDFL